ncbi:MAG: T9SS type A sorting domain-containing protein [Ignavibacteriaceae bacterium]|jgi:N-acetylneuraminic acid mutarotase|nr:T9SS type A sorting domain-containing protein [Ignavibacterium sp.]MCU0365025.1 T9SS type A sorting domain-containing protein [Ignavibacteriaceae bacterium]
MLSLTKSRLSADKAGLAGKTFLQTLFLFLLVTQICFGQGTWTKIGDMPEIRYTHSADEINGKVYIAGGISTEAGVWPTTMLVYDKADSSWTTIPLPDTLVRAWHTSCVVGNNLYLIGGVILQGTTWNSTNEVYMFNTYNGEWTQKNPMPTDRCNLSCSLIDNKIYVVGGMHYINNVPDYNGLKKIEVYDLATETWSTLPDMPTYRWGLSIVAFDNKIYVFGGRSLSIRHTALDVFDPQDSSWTTVTNIPTPRYQLATCVIDSSIYAIDGWYSSSSGPIYDTVEVYNPITDVWTTGTSMPVSVAMLDGYVLDGKIYMYGGSFTTHPNIGISDIWEFTPSPVSVETEVTVPSGFKLEQNYPNPFNPATKIKYTIPQTSQIQIKVFDVLGNEIATLVDEYKPAGKYEVEFSAKGGSASGGNAYNLPSGVYFYKLKAGSFVETKKMILIR